MLMVSFYILWKYQKTTGYSQGVQIETSGAKWVNLKFFSYFEQFMFLTRKGAWLLKSWNIVEMLVSVRPWNKCWISDNVRRKNNVVFLYLAIMTVMLSVIVLLEKKNLVSFFKRMFFFEKSQFFVLTIWCNVWIILCFVKIIRDTIFLTNLITCRAQWFPGNKHLNQKNVFINFEVCWSFKKKRYVVF